MAVRLPETTSARRAWALGRHPAGRRGGLLAAAACLVLLAAGCGRASQAEIDGLLGITPTATRSAEDIAAATQSAQAAASARAAAASSPGTAGQVASAGDPVRGRRQFGNYCLQCHGPGGSGPNLVEVGGAAAGLTYDQLLVLIREGANHPPGPYASFTLSDRAVGDIHAYLLEQSGG